MQSTLILYQNTSQVLRLIVVIMAAILLNGIYCLVYRYTAGNPATLWEAFSWGLVNLMPWIVAIELGRQSNQPARIALMLLAALITSLVLGALVNLAWPSGFELVRRLPGLGVAAIAISAFKLAAHRAREDGKSADVASYKGAQWARAAGNYVELHEPGRRIRLIRTTLSNFAAQDRPDMVRIHRSYVVASNAIASMERHHVKLRCGLRLPIGHHYRGRISLTKSSSLRHI
jgi:hypothetical protein